MSDVKISDLSPAGTLSGAEVLPVVQLGSTVRASVTQVGNFLMTLALPLVLGSAVQPGITTLAGVTSLGTDSVGWTVRGPTTFNDGITVFPGTVSPADFEIDVLINGTLTVNPTAQFNGGILVSAGGINIVSGGLVADSITSVNSISGLFVQVGTVVIDNTVANGRFTIYRSSGNNRWFVGADTTAEGGANSGSNFIFQAYDDTGAPLDTPITVARAAGGSLTLARPVVVSTGGIAVTGNSTINGTLGGISTLTATTLIGTLSTAAQPNITSVGTLTSLTVSAASANLTVSAASSSVAIDISGPAANVRDLVWQTAGVNRWVARADTSAESGSNAGSAFQLIARDDSGATIDNVISIVRAAGGTMSISRPTAFSSFVGVGNGATTSALINVGAASMVLTGTTQDGMLMVMTGSSAATTGINGLRVRGASAAASFTVATVAGVHVLDAVKGAGSTITQQTGILVDAQTQGSAAIGIQVTQGTLAVGLFVTQTSGTTREGLLISGGAQTGATSASIIGIAQTWNTTGAPTGIIVKITNTASGSGARLIDLQVGGSSKHAVDVSGNLLIAGTQVLTTRQTGWAAWTGTATRTTKATSTATLQNVAEAMKAVLDDLIAHGLIGT